MSGFVSVGYTPPNDRHFVSVADMSTMLGPTGRQHSVKSAYFFAKKKIVSGNCIPDTLSYVFVGISTDEVI